MSAIVTQSMLVAHLAWDDGRGQMMYIATDCQPGVRRGAIKPDEMSAHSRGLITSFCSSQLLIQPRGFLMFCSGSSHLG